jgi:hypothetical protein
MTVDKYFAALNDMIEANKEQRKEQKLTGAG